MDDPWPKLPRPAILPKPLQSTNRLHEASTLRDSEPMHQVLQDLTSTSVAAVPASDAAAVVVVDLSSGGSASEQRDQPPPPPTAPSTLTTPLAEVNVNTPAQSLRLLRKPSPGLLARLKLLDSRTKSSRLVSDQTATNGHPGIDKVGRIPEGHIRELEGFYTGSHEIVIHRNGRAFIGPRTPNVTADAVAPHSTLKLPDLDFGGREGHDFFNLSADAAMAAFVHADSDHSSIISTSDRIAPSDSEHEDTQKYRLPDNVKSRGSSRNGFVLENTQTGIAGPDRPPTPPPKDSPMASRTSFFNGSEPEGSDVDSYYNPYGLSRAASIYTLGRASFTDQIYQLTSIKLPQASSLSANITAIPTSFAAARALNDAADQIRRWIRKASEVLGGLDAEDDVEWAAAGGREGLGEVDVAINRFEQLIDVYVGAVEHLETRGDIATLSSKDLTSVVERMERITDEWSKIRENLQGIKEQVEIAMEWEDLWNNTLGQIGQEIDSLNRLIFEMEERRHKNSLLDPNDPSNHQLDFNELETIVEEAPSRNPGAGNRLSLVPPFPSADSTPQAAQSDTAKDESNLMALFARMQPLRASLDFVPMTLTGFLNRSEAIFPSACEDLKHRLEDLEAKYMRLDADAEALRKELGEDRWVLMFRKAGLKAIKMCESVERSVAKLRDELDDGTQHTNPTVVSSKVHTYEQKKQHYCPSIQRVLDVFNRGVQSRSTINGEVIRLQEDLQRRWSEIESQTRAMDFALAQLDLKNQTNLRDSVSTILSQGTAGSSVPAALDTPGSSPASSVILMSRHSSEQGVTTPYGSASKSSRQGSFASNATLNSAKRFSSLPTPPSARSTHMPMKTPLTRSSASEQRTPSTGVSSRLYSPSPARSVSRNMSRAEAADDKPSKPRWNASTNLRDTAIGHNFKPLTLTTPSPYRKDGALLSPRSVSSPHATTARPHPSPLGRGVTTATNLPPRSTTSTAISRPPSTPPKTLPRLRAQASTSQLPAGGRATAAAAATAALARAPRSSSGTATPQPSKSHLPRASMYFTPGTAIPGVTPGASTASDASTSSTTTVTTTNRRSRASMAPLDLPEEPETTSGAEADMEDSPSSRPSKTSRPSTALASRRRSSMLPQPKRNISGVSGSSAAPGRSSRAGRRTSMGLNGGAEDGKHRWRV
jgi:Yeast cortical protein KAR9